MKHLLTTAALCAAAFFATSNARSQSMATTPRTITYQGVLANPAGKATSDSTYNVTVRLYSDEAGTQEVWRGTYPVNTVNGVFNVALGSGEHPFPEATAMDKPLWLGMQIEGNPEMRPLSSMSAAAFALNVPDQSISASKISADYVKSFTFNGQKLTGNGRDINIQTGDGILASIDEATNSVFLKSMPTLNGVKGGSVEGNTTISGSLTVTGATFLGSNGSTPVYINSLTPGSIPFIGTSNVIAQDNGRLFWDRTNYRLGIGTSSPTKTLDVRGDVSLGTNSANTLAVNGSLTTNIVPLTDDAVDLGDLTHWFSHVYTTDLILGPHSLTMTNGTIETQMTMPTPGSGMMQFNVINMTTPLSPIISTPLTIDEYGMQTTDLQTDAITSGLSVKIDGTNFPRTIESDDDFNISINPTLDGAVNLPGTLGKKIRLFAGVGGTGASGGDLILASGAKGSGGPTDGTIYFKTGGVNPGTTQMYIDPNGVTISNALFTTGTFSSSAIIPVLYGGTAANSTLSLLTTNSTSAPTGSITLGGSTGAGTATFATMNATSVNLGSGVALKTNGTTRISTSGDATFTTLTSNGAAAINNNNNANTQINTGTSTGTVDLGNFANGGNLSLRSHGTITAQGATNINTTGSDGNTSIGNASNTLGLTASTITATGALNTHGAATINTTGSDGNTSIGNASNTVGVTASTITATGALNTHGAATMNTTASDGNTSIGNASNTLGLSASTITTTGAVVENGSLTTHGDVSLNTTASDGNTSIGNASNTVGVTASTITATGALNTHGAATINTTAADGNTSIGNTSNTLGLSASTITTTGAVVANGTLTTHGVTNINATTNDGNTTIGNSGNTLNLYGSTVNVNGASLNVTGGTSTFDDITMSNNAAAGRTLKVADAASGNSGDGLTILAGTATGTNKNGGALTIASGAKTGTGSSGDVVIKTGGASGTTQMTVNNAGGVTINNGNLNVANLTGGQAVVTDASKNLASLAYGSSNAASTLVQRDANGDFAAGAITSTSLNASAGTITTTGTVHGANLTVSPLTNSDGISIGSGSTGNDITGNSWSVAHSGAITASALNAGSGTVQTTGTVQGGVVNATTGFELSGAATTGTMLRGNGANYVATTATYPNDVTAGEVLYASANHVIGRLAASTTQYQVLQSTGSAPAYDAVHLNQSAAVTGQLPIANGGTNASSFGNNKVVVSNGSGTTLVDGPAWNGGTSTITGNITGNAATVSTNADLSGDVTSVGNVTTVANVDDGALSANVALLDADQTFSGNVNFGNTVSANINGNAATVTTNANLSGPITSSGNSTSITNGAVTLAKIANIADQTILGNNSGNAAAPIALTATQTKTVLSLDNVENTALSSWAGTSNVTTVGTITSGTWNGSTIDVAHGGTNATSFGNNKVVVSNGTGTTLVDGPLWNSGTSTITGNVTGNAATVTNGVYTTGDQTIGGTKTFSNTITGSIDGNAATVTNGVYTTSDQTIGGTKTFSNTITGSIDGNAATVTNGVYTTGDQTIGGTKTFSNTISGSIDGNAATVTTNANLSGPITSSGNTTSITDGAVTLGKIANIADATILGNNSGNAAAPIALSVAQTKTVLALNNVENTALSTWAGSSNVTTLGTVTTGTWNAGAVSTTGAISATGTDPITAGDASHVGTLAVTDGSGGHTASIQAGAGTATLTLPSTTGTLARSGGGATAQATPGNPTATTSTTPVQMGLAGSITPSASGKVMIIISGDLYNTQVGDGAVAQLSYGTGSAPSNGAAATGTTAGSQVEYVAATAGSAEVPFTTNAVVTGLTLGTTYWIDLQVKEYTGGSAGVNNISISAIELP